jgi:hypothetical protein
MTMLLMPPVIIQEQVQEAPPARPEFQIATGAATVGPIDFEDPSRRPVIVMDPRPSRDFTVQVTPPVRQFDLQSVQRIDPRAADSNEERRRIRATGNALAGAVFGNDFDFVDEANFTGVERDMPGSDWRLGIGEIESETPPALREENDGNRFRHRSPDIYGIRFRLTFGGGQ